MSWTIYSEDVNTGQRIYVGKTTDLDNKPKVNQETGGFLVCLDDLVNGVYYWDSDIMDWRELDKKVIP